MFLFHVRHKHDSLLYAEYVGVAIWTPLKINSRYPTIIRYKIPRKDFL